MNNDPNPIVEDWGQITSAAVTFDDFGSVTEVWTAYEVWTTEYLYVGSGTLFELGNGLERQLSPYVGSGTVRFSGSGSVVRRSAISVSGFVPFFDGDSAEDLGGAIYGLPTNYANYGTVVDPIESVDNGGVVGVDLTPLVEERYSFSYNLSSVTASSQADFNYELITQTPTAIEDYLSIDIPGENLDYGFTSESAVYPTVNPFGPITIFGSALIAFSDDSIETTALFSITGNADISNPLQAYVTGIGNVTLNGITDTDRIRSYVGSGIVSGISGSAESFTVSLNTTQLFVVTGQVSQSFSKGLYTGSGSLFGFNGYTNFKYINAVDETTGLFKIFGASIEKQTESYNESSTVDYNWGFVNEIPTSTEDYENPILPWNNLPEDFGSVLSISTQDLLPFGSITFLSSAFEANTESYNESSIFDGQYGFIDQIPSVIVDNGYSEGLGANAYPIDYLTIDIPVSIETPFGFSTIFGSASSAKIANPPENTILFNIYGASLTRVPFQQWQGSGQSKIFGFGEYTEIDAFNGSGSIGFVSGAAEVFGANPPENTQLFSIVGSGAYSETEIFIGSGFFNASGSVDINFTTGAGESTILFNIYNNAEYSETEVFVGSGSIDFVSGSAEVLSVNPPENTQLFSIVGSGVYRETDVFIGSGFFNASGSADINFTTGAGESTILFNLSGSAIEKNTESYNESSVVEYDWGYVNEFATESEDYEDSIPTLPWVIGPEDFGSLGDVVTGNITPYGSITAFGSAIESNTESYNESAIFDGDYGSIEDPATVINNGFVYEINPFVTTYGLVDELITTNIPYGNITHDGFAVTSEIATYTAVGSGSIITSGSAVIKVRLDIRYPGSGEASFFGNALDSESDVFIGSGSLAFSNIGAEVFGANPPENTQLFTITGIGVYSEVSVFTKSGSGFINVIGGELYSETNAFAGSGQIQLSGNSTNSETEVFTGSGFTQFSAIGAEVFGANPPENTQLFSIVGSGVYTETDVFIGSGFFNASGSADINFTTGAGESTILFNIYNNAEYSETDAFNGSGSITTFGSAIESNTESYNESAIFDGDYGSIEDSATIIDNGFVYDLNPSIVNYESIDIATSVSVPYGYMNSSGVASTSEIATYTSEGSGYIITSGSAIVKTKLDIRYVGSGSTNISGNGSYSETDAFIGSGSLRFSDTGAEVFGANPPENTQLFSIVGSGVYSETDAFTGSGFLNASGSADINVTAGAGESTILFSISGSAIEKNTESYNESSVVEYDWGYVNEFATGSEDYEDSIPVLPWVTGPEDFGSLVDVATGNITPYGSITFLSGGAEVFGVNPPENIQLFAISGSALSTDINTYTAIGSGFIQSSGSAVIKFTTGAGESTILFNLVGTGVSAETEVFVGSGYITTSGNAYESNTESYNKSSIYDADYGLITDVAEASDSGFISDTAESVNYGLLGDTIIPNTPYGYVISSGSATAVEIATYTAVGSGSIITYGSAIIRSKLDIRYIGSGSFKVADTGAEVFGANPPENIQLFSITGVAATKLTSFYEFIGQGFTNISGSAIYKETDAFNGSGSINVVGSAGIRFAPSIDETVLFNISGNAVEKHTESYNESATIEYDWGYVNEFATQSEDYEDSIPTLPWVIGPEDFGSVLDSATQTIRPYGSITTFGSAIEKNTESYNESSIFDGDYGSIQDPAIIIDNGFVYDLDTVDLTYGSVSDVIVANIPYGTSTFSGQATNIKNTDSYVGSGSINASGSAGIRFSPSIDETVLFNISGNASHSETDVFTGSGRAVFSGAASTAEFALYRATGSGQVNFTGAAVYKETDAFAGSGSINVVGSAGIRFSPSIDETVLFNISGAGLYSETEVFTGSGSLRFSDAGAEVFGVNPPENIQLFSISGAGVYSETDVFIGSGTETLTGVASVSEIATYTIAGSGAIIPAGYGIYSESDVFIGSGSVVISGAGVYSETDTFNGSGSITIFGNALDTETDVFTGSGVSRFTGTAKIVSRLDIRYKGDAGDSHFFGDGVYSETDAFNGSGSIGFVSGAAEVFGANPPENTQLFSITGVSVYRETNAEVGSGSISISGAGVYSETDAFNGSGQINLSGNALDSESEVFTGSGSFRFSDAGAEVFGVNPPENIQLFSITGVSVYRETNAEVGSGSFRFSDSGAEVFGANPPENTQLFKINGAGVYSETDVFIGSGSVVISGAGVYSETDVFNGSGQINISGNALDKETEVFAGSGFFRFSDAGAQVFGVNPPENTQLFSVVGAGAYSETDVFTGFGTVNGSGVGVYRESNVEIGSGTLRFFGSSTEIFSANPQENIQLFNISGAGVYSETDAFTGSGNIILSGNALDSESEVFTGSGSLRFSDAGAEVFGANPPENIQLFSITGAGVYKETNAEVGSGFINTSGSAGIKFTSGAGESTILFNLSGVANYSETDVFTGSGQSVFSGAASTAEFALYTATTSGTITLSGVAQTREIATYQDYITSGQVTLSGIASTKFAPSYNGSGSFRFSDVGAEVFGANPPENIQLINISGAAATREISIIQEVAVGPQYVFYGAATNLKKVHAYTEFVGAIKYTNLSESKVSHTESYVGSGVISTVSGAAEVFGANPPENIQLFTATGSANTRETNLYQAVGSGSITTTGFASDLKVCHTEIGFGSISISGGFDIVIRLRIAGSGVISALSGAAEVYGPNPPENIQLFNISGAATTAERNAYLATGSGTSFFSGNITEKNTESYSGSGILSTVSGAAEVFGANPSENIQLFKINGAGAYSETDVFTGVGAINNSGQSTAKLGHSYNGRGSIAISGKQTSPAEFKHTGSGSLFTTNGSAEVFGANPIEETLLYQFVGSAKDTHTERYTGSGKISSTGIATEIHSESYAGSGILSTVSGAAGVFGANPPENIQLFNISGSAITSKSQQKSYAGSTDVEVSGASTEIKANAFKGFCIIGIYPSSIEKNTESYVGTGNLSTIGGSAIAKGSNPQEETNLYQVSGSATTKVISSFVTTGSATLQGNATEKNTERHIGSGQITISGTTSGQYGIVSLTNTILFSIKGDSKSRVRFAPVCREVNYRYGDNNAITEVRSFDPPSLFVAIF